MDKTINLTINGKTYAVKLNDNRTVEYILTMLPLELTLKRYAGHEYYGLLPEKPSIKGVAMTSDVHAGGLYYYDGWNAFTVLYGDAQIDPYKVVHLGDAVDDVISPLKTAGDTVKALIEIQT